MFPALGHGEGGGALVSWTVHAGRGGEAAEGQAVVGGGGPAQELLLRPALGGGGGAAGGAAVPLVLVQPKEGVVGTWLAPVRRFEP